MPLVINSIEAPMGGLAGAPRRHIVRVGFDIGFFSASRRPVLPTFWQTGDNLPVAADQSNTPVAFQLANGNRSIPITVKGHHDFNTIPQWAGVRFKLTGVCGGVGIESPYTAWTGADGSFTATNFTFLAGLSINYPFRAAGDWVWTITAQGALPALTAVAVGTTRIEMNVLVGDPDPVFNNILWAELLRLAVPPYAAGAGLNQALQPTQTTYMAFIANNLWNFATPSQIRYDCQNGAPHFGTTSHGGDFRLANFLGPSFVTLGPITFPWNCWRVVNCYDLAAIVALAFRALGNRANNLSLVLPPLWRFMNPFGYVTDGPLYGWPQYQNLNSPFWLSPWWWPNGPQHFANPLDPNRTRFANHAFNEVDFLAPPSEQVVDVCKAVLPAGGPPIVIPDGSQDRTAYMAAGINVGFAAVAQTLHIGMPGITRII